MKVKDASIAIESNDELAMFMSRMRSIIIPPPRRDGKPSARPPKDVEVQFEDASTDDVEDTQAHNSSGKGQSNGKPSKLGSGLHATQSGSSKRASSEVPTDLHPNLLNGTALREKYVGQLQKRWQCVIHTKSPQSPVWCYRDPTWGDSSGCQKLTYANLSFWALEIMEDRATVEEKPLTLRLDDPKPRSRGPGGPNPVMQGHPTTFAGGPYYLPPPYYYPPYSHDPYNHAGHMPHPYAGAPTQNPLVPSQTTTIPSTSQPSQADIPIVQWFAYLDQVEERNKDGIQFTQYGPILQQNQFMRVSQLLEFTGIPLTSLQELLKIPLGTATLIIQYAKCDLEDLRAGHWVFPQSDLE